MLFLPPAHGDDRCVRLPVPDQAAAQLAACWLIDDVAVRRQQLEALLCGESSLLLWCVLRGGATLAITSGLPDVAKWLDAVGCAAFRSDDPACEDASEDQLVAWAEVAAAVQQLDQRTRDTTPAELHSYIRLCAALYFADRWLQLAQTAPPDTDTAGDAADWWPDCRRLLQTDAEQAATSLPNRLELAARRVRETAQQLAPQSPSPTSQVIRSRWMTSSREHHAWPLALAEKLRQLRRLESRFSAAVEEEKLTALKEFAYGISHELNNPLTNIASRAQTLLRDETDVERRRKLATINSQAFRAYEMIADLMLFARPPQMEPRQINVVELLAQVLHELRDAAAAQQTELANMSSEQEVSITADPTYLSAAIKALGVNSLEALAAGGRIEVAASRTDWQPDDLSGGSWVAITVRDNGPGIPASVRRHMFDPYYSGREAGRGLGLGLSKCWRVVSLHGGRIDVHSDALGTLLTMYLPVHRSQRSAPMLLSTASESAPLNASL